MTTVPAVRPAAVAAVLAKSAQWVSARRKLDGRPFFFVPGSKGAVYMADATCCTCPDAANRARACKHSLAVAMFKDAEAKRLGLATDAEVNVIVGSASAMAPTRYNALFPLCEVAGCREDALRAGRCLEHRERVAA